VFSATNAIFVVVWTFIVPWCGNQIKRVRVPQGTDVIICNRLQSHRQHSILWLATLHGLLVSAAAEVVSLEAIPVRALAPHLETIPNCQGQLLVLLAFLILERIAWRFVLLTEKGTKVKQLARQVLLSFQLSLILFLEQLKLCNRMIYITIGR